MLQKENVTKHKSFSVTFAVCFLAELGKAVSSSSVTALRVRVVFSLVYSERPRSV